ncbi:hypothetical protein RFI_08536 [Reticulomyxa filosa]|uniref:BTB domain-containing protein n=1 Tax=Reticulomyxa filosa TaxID=46433 RepID=X6NTF9_RETFI|nr:hypothetical protein RFI_08536 [Reticulomyxa filosa]|eukprot:ETO28592.1 hypothetical protein RFI_08536 [Reticulomyxa filosa]
MTEVDFFFLFLFCVPSLLFQERRKLWLQKKGTGDNAEKKGGRRKKTTNNFKKYWLRLVKEPQFHDVTFIVGKGKDQEVIGANKALLAIHCPVFEAMFNSSMMDSSHCLTPFFFFFKKKKKKADSEIPLPDVDPIVFRTMLHWMVSDQLRVLSITYLLPLIRLADYYQIKPLVATSCSYLKSKTITIYVVLDQALTNHHGADLGLANHNLKNQSLRVRILCNSTVADARAAIAQHLGWLFLHVFCIFLFLFFFLKK